MATGKATFKKVASVKVNDTTNIVISQVIEAGEVKGFYINNFITSEKYTGPTKGTMIPVAQMPEFKDAVEIALSN